jgi:two-component system alkaline phosphatase synthesis response regulator PhoP
MANKILIIDDDIDLVESMANLLEAKNYSVCIAHNGQDGVQMARTEKPDLILLDVMMTTRDEGFNVARNLSQIPELKGTPVVMVSGVRKEMNLPFQLEPDESWLPIKEFLEKPIKPETLLIAVQKHIRKG